MEEKQLRELGLGCSDNGCYFIKPKVGTNGGCRCFEKFGYGKSQLKNIIQILPELLIEKNKVKMCVETINAVQNTIGILTTNSSAILEPIREAWNLNANALSNLGKEQNEYLKKAYKNASKIN